MYIRYFSRWIPDNVDKDLAFQINGKFMRLIKWLKGNGYKLDKNSSNGTVKYTRGFKKGYITIVIDGQYPELSYGIISCFRPKRGDNIQAREKIKQLDFPYKMTNDYTVMFTIDPIDMEGLITKLTDLTNFGIELYGRR